MSLAFVSVWSSRSTFRKAPSGISACSTRPSFNNSTMRRASSASPSPALALAVRLCGMVCFVLFTIQTGDAATFPNCGVTVQFTGSKTNTMSPNSG